MVIHETEWHDKIAALTYQDWQPLLALIPKIQRASYFGTWSGAHSAGGGQFPYCVPAPVVSQFIQIVYAIPIIIVFDWGAWDEGRKILRDDTFDFDSIDLLTKCKLITAIVRNDRFCEGALEAAFASGLILKILKSIEREVKTK